MIRWNKDRDDKLTQMWKDGIHVDTIAAALGGTRKAVWQRVSQLDLSATRHVTAYKPEAGNQIPCCECGTMFTRIRVTARLCGSPECVLARRRVKDSGRRADGICPRCGTNPRPVRPDGSLRSWCRSCESAQKAEYLRSEAGRAVARRYFSSEKGRAALRRARENLRAKKMRKTDSEDA